MLALHVALENRNIPPLDTSQYSCIAVFQYLNYYFYKCQATVTAIGLFTVFKHITELHFIFYFLKTFRCIVFMIRKSTP